jgi:predicted alpha/beta hydrolase family esterase
MWIPRLHGAVDALAMWSEDLRRRAPAPFVAADREPLDCFGPLPPLPKPPDRPGAWESPSPRPAPGDETLRVEVTPAVGERRGTAVLVPPWKLPRLSLLSGWTTTIARTGHEVWTIIPPRHLHRSPPGVRSGEAFVTPDVPALRRAVEQLVLEIRLLLALAHRRGGEVALVGLSLGGLAAALAATAEEAPARVAMIAPPADLHAVAAETRIGRRILGLAARGGVTPPAIAELPEMLWPFRAHARPSRSERAFVAIGEADGIALTAAATELARAWGADLRAYPRGHLTLLFFCSALRRDLRAFLGEPAPAVLAAVPRPTAPQPAG